MNRVFWECLKHQFFEKCENEKRNKENKIEKKCWNERTDVNKTERAREDILKVET